MHIPHEAQLWENLVQRIPRRRYILTILSLLKGVE